MKFYYIKFKMKINMQIITKPQIQKIAILINQFGLKDEAGISAATFHIVDSLQKPFHIMGQEILATMSMGTAVSPQDGSEDGVDEPTVPLL